MSCVFKYLARGALPPSTCSKADGSRLLVVFTLSFLLSASVAISGLSERSLRHQDYVDHGILMDYHVLEVLALDLRQNIFIVLERVPQLHRK